MATSSESGPPFASSARPTSQAGRSGSATSRAASSSAASPGTSSRSSPAPTRPSIRPSVYISRDQSSLSNSSSCARGGRGATPRSRPPGAGTGATLPPVSSSGGGCPANRTVALRAGRSSRTVATVVNVSCSRRSLIRTCSSAGSTSSSGTRASTSARQATRSITPRAASSVPWPQTSPTMRSTRSGLIWTTS